jgi:hypothetical protein
LLRLHIIFGPPINRCLIKKTVNIVIDVDVVVVAVVVVEQVLGV